MLGLCGAHRVGKSTLAKTYAAKEKATYVEVRASDVFKDMGLDPAVTYDFGTRLSVQEEILRRFDKVYAKHTDGLGAITDRTPIDLMAYTLADATGNAVGEEHQARLKKYIQDCFDVTNRRFSAIVLVQPGIPVVYEEGKAALNEAYMEHLNSLILGLIVDPRRKAQHFYLPRQMTDLDERVKAVSNCVSRVEQAVSAYLAAEVMRSGPVAIH